MALYEFDEGEDARFYRIELDGPRLNVCWGLIGTSGTQRVIECASEAEAKADFQRLDLERREAGYRLVRDESVPRDRDAAREESLGRASPLSRNPRLSFQNKRRNAFFWLEANGSTLLTAEGTLGQEGKVSPRSEECSSPAAALKKRDRVVASLLAQGYQFAEIDAARPAPRAQHRAGSLGQNRALEAAIRASPDEANWLALEEWLVAQGDPRAEIVRLEKTGERSAAAQARGRLLKLLLGPKAEQVSLMLAQASWRAGFLRSCRVSLPERRALDALAEFVGSPASLLLGEIDMWSIHNNEVRDICETLGAAPFAAGLRSLAFGVEGDHISFDGELESLTNLSRLKFYSPTDLRHSPVLDRLEHLWLMPSTRDGLRALFVPAGLGAVRGVLLDARKLNRACEPLREQELVELLSGSAAPRIETLEVLWAGDESVRGLLAALESAPLLRRLRALSFGGELIAPDRRPGAFSHLETLRLPPGLLE